MSLLPSNLCLMAGAGAGKTTRLVETYAQLLDQGIGDGPLKPNQIVAITFTDKAAAEMKSRINAHLDDQSGQAAELAWAPISTIHGFCAQLLREHGVALGLDPDFAVLDQDQFDALLSEAVQELLRIGLKERDPLLDRLLGHYYLGGRGELSEHLIWLHKGLATMGLSAQLASQATARAHEKELGKGAGLVAELDGAIAEVAALYGADPGLASSKAKYVAKVAALLEQWQTLGPALQNEPTDLAALRTLKKLVSGPTWGKVFTPLRKRLTSARERLISLRALPASAALAQDLLALAQDLRLAVERELTRRAALDFDSLLIKARDLLRDHAGVLAQLRGRWQVLLVDEYQDVNPVQGELVALLAGLNQKEGARPKPPRLMVVGDRKQSIYAFRGAAVSVFSATMDDFESGGGLVEALPYNYRSHPALVDFFNRLFEQVFVPGDSAQYAPESWVNFRPDDRQQSGGSRPGSPDEQVVDILDCRKLAEPKAPLAAWRYKEAKALAAWLGGVLQRGEFKPGKVALLFRRFTSVGIYEEALSGAGIESYTVKGRGFYGCQEISDLALALQALLDSKNEIALAAWLRSPLVGLNDESLLALVHPNPPELAKLSLALAGDEPLPAWCGAEQQNRLLRARALLKELGGLARRLKPAELLTWLMERSQLIPLLLGTRAGAQKTANLRKLIETARQPTGALAGGVEAFAQALGALAADPPKDPMAPLMGEEAQVVRLMTIHQAKGLEFPLVILPDLAGLPSRGGNLPDLGPGGVLAPAPLDPSSGARLHSSLYDGLRLRAKAVQEAEDARLFYVACTRAEERLLICLNGASRQGRWSKWTQKLILEDPAVNLVDAADLSEAQTAPPQALARNWPGFLPPGPGKEQKAAARVLAQSLYRPPAKLALVRESVSGLEDFFACPRLYLMTQRLALDTAALPGKGQGGGLARAVELGSLVHHLLEVCDLKAGPTGLSAVLASLQPDPELAKQALLLAQGLWDTELPGLLEPVPSQGLHRELPFNLLLAAENDGADLELIGELDLAARLPSGGWLIADYKVSNKADPEPYREQLGLYALALYKGQEQEPPPQAALCFLGSKGGVLKRLQFSPDDLAVLEQRVRQAASDIAALGAVMDPFSLEPGPACAQGKCPLAWLCEPGKAAP